MNRRSFFSSLSAVIAATGIAKSKTESPRFTNRKRFYGVVDYRSDHFDPPAIRESHGGTVFLDGIEIKYVAYANTETGVVRTYDIFKNNSITTTRRCYTEPLTTRPTVVDVSVVQTEGFWKRKLAIFAKNGDGSAVPQNHYWVPNDFKGRVVDCPEHGVLIETLVGKVEIWGPPTGTSGSFLFPAITGASAIFPKLVNKSLSCTRWARKDFRKAAQGSTIDLGALEISFEKKG